MSRIDVGKAVWVGYTPNDQVSPDARQARCRTGTVTGGPYSAGTVAEDTDGKMWSLNERGWTVFIDPQPGLAGMRVLAIESMIFPIDDDPDPATETTEEKAVTA